MRVNEIENSKPFHARIFRNYLEYLSKHEDWSDSEIESFLEEVGSSSAQIKDDSSWFSLDFADRFFDALALKTGNERIAYEAGVYIQSEGLNTVIHRLIKGLMKVKSVYKLAARFAGHFSKASSLKVLSAGSSEAEIEAVNEIELPYRSYICENRMGIFAGTPKIFGLPEAKVCRKECVYRGDKRCVYRVEWKEQFLEKSWIKAGALTAVLICTLGFFTKPVWGLLAGFVSLLLFVLFSLWRLMKQQHSELMGQNESLDQSLKAIEKKNRELLLVSQISKLTHQSTNPQELERAIVENVAKVLEFDRAMFLRVQPERGSLRVESHYGFSEEIQELLEDTEFNLQKEASSGFFVQVVNTKKPLLISNVEERLSRLSPRSQKFAKMLGTKSFIAVPLFSEEAEVVGVLAVDNNVSDREIQISDQELLMTLGEHLGIALQKARLLKGLEENLQMSQQYSEEQRRLKEIFERFVPSEIARGLSSLGSTELQVRRLKAVKKKNVSILFADIFNFSKLSQGQEPEEIISWLNSIYSKLEPIITKNQGYIDKFMGDGMIAIFEGHSSAIESATAAIEMIQWVQASQSELQMPCEIGIGLHYGSTILGNVGSDNRLNFTALGESVNLCARLESHTRQLGPNRICSSAAFRKYAGEQFQWAELGQIPLKGYGEVLAFELKAPKLKSDTDSRQQPLKT